MVHIILSNPCMIFFTYLGIIRRSPELQCRFLFRMRRQRLLTPKSLCVEWPQTAFESACKPLIFGLIRASSWTSVKS